MSEEKNSNMGRPRKDLENIEFDGWDMLDTIIVWTDCLGCSEKLGVSKNTIVRKIKEKHGLTFEEYKAKKQTDFKMNLLKTQYEVAVKEKNPIMLKWLGKQYLGQRENHELEIKQVELPKEYRIVTYGTDAIETTAKEVDDGQGTVQEQTDTRNKDER